jgi:hypothetical protein
MVSVSILLAGCGTIPSGTTQFDGDWQFRLDAPTDTLGGKLTSSGELEEQIGALAEALVGAMVAVLDEQLGACLTITGGRITRWDDGCDGTAAIISESDAVIVSGDLLVFRMAAAFTSDHVAGDHPPILRAGTSWMWVLTLSPQPDGTLRGSVTISDGEGSTVKITVLTPDATSGGVVLSRL